MRTKEFEDWVHSMFGVCQQGVAGLQQLKASSSLPSIQLPPVAMLQVVAAKFAALNDSDSDSDSNEDL